jgi:hypothetical protein
MKSSSVYSLKINYGLSVISFYKVLFNYLLDNNIYSEIHYCLYEDNIKRYRESYPEKYKDDLKILCDFLFSDSRIIQKEELSEPLIEVWDIISQYSIPNNLTLDYRNLIIEEPIIKEEYITINTKIADVFHNDLDAFLPNLLSLFKESKYKIILLGERNMSPCYEYTIHKDYFSCIYNKLLEANLNCIDMTYDETYNGYSIEAVKRSMNICKYSKLNIVLNSGGALAISVGVGNTYVITSKLGSITSRAFKITNIYDISKMKDILDDISSLIT